MTPAESRVRSYQWLMRFLAVLYAVSGAAFFFFPDRVFALVNIGGQIFKGVEAMPTSVEHFWLVLATSMMAMLSALSLFSSRYPHVKGYALVHMLSKSVSTAGFLYQFLNSQHYFGYLVGIATDFPLLLIVAWSTIRVPSERAVAAAKAAQSQAARPTGAPT